LILLLGIVAAAGLAWQNYPALRSAPNRWLNQKEVTAARADQKEPISYSASAQISQGQAYPVDPSPSNGSKNRSLAENSHQDRTLGAEELTSDSPSPTTPIGEVERVQVATLTQETEPAQVAGSTEAAEPTQVAESTEAATSTEATESTQKSIGLFVENWCRAWQEGDLQTYIACYHPDFNRGGMNQSGWKAYMQNRFKGSAKRNIQLSDLHTQVNDSAAVVTFKQRYLRGNYRSYGLKTLHLTHHQGRWTILREFIKRFPDVAEKVDKS
jgi:hypothetical protein